MTHSWQSPGASDVAIDRSILILEDNETLALGLRTSLEVEGYKVECVTDGNDGLTWLSQHNPDLIVLDLMLPGLNGFEVLRRYRAGGGTAAVLILSARDQEVDKVQGFRIGADDYVVKPIGVLEFLARVEAIIRRLAPAGRGTTGDAGARIALHRFSDVVVDLRTRTVLRGGKPVDLSPMEFDFLSFLIDSGGDIVSRETLMRQVWRYSLGVTSRTVDQHVARLRNKLEPDPAQPRHLITVRKAGYRFQR
ncbi:MAG TPA: response regulator transcription factor [Gemmatimonadaceae bacterium]|jgi:DNA-binding response OmpR family regulator|nr:response regulator transcription factor [Gemmatimonadaceae bacterium]